MSTELRRAVEQVARRFRILRLWTALAVCWVVWAAAGACLWLANASVGFRLLSAEWAWVLLPIIAGTVSACAFAAFRSVGDVRWVARRIEAKHPELATGLLAAIEEAAAAPSGQLGYLQSSVIRKALEHRHANDWNETVPTWRLRASKVAHLGAIGALMVVTTGLAAEHRQHAEARKSSLSQASVADVQVDPGNTEVERGTSLLVVARFLGGVPAEAKLIVEDQLEKVTERGMIRSLEDPTFAGHVPSVDADLSYRVGFDGKTTDSFRVHVFEYPELERTDAQLKFPGYTLLEPKTVEDIRHVTAVEGTELTLICRLNKQVATAQLVDAEGQVVALAQAEENKPHYRTTLTLSDPRRFRLNLVDREGRSNKLPTELVINVTRNRVPVVKMIAPARDVQVSPIEELEVKAEIDDDFGIVRHGLTYAMAGREPREIIMPSPAAKTRRLETVHMIDFESLHAAPDQLLTYFYWADDIGPDGQTRRTSGDMFFAEVRPFDEIFRQGEQPPSGSDESEQEGQEGNAQASDRLAELQKEIINGTWKLIRRETVGKPTAKLTDDAKVLEDAQQTAIDQAGQLASRLQDATSKSNLAQATAAMKAAKTHLGDVAQKSSVHDLNAALASAQSAYQALLKLRAREIQVVRGNRQQRQSSRNSSGRQSQRQLQQLELTEDENRFENQRTAREQVPKKEQQERETRQVVNRLRELAQRQDDVNNRLKELQSALEAAKTQPARDEIERQLKRLRDQQRQILRDTDELRERMEREENRDQLADARQQVEEGREHVRQAAEALEQGRVPQALTEGARAGRQFNDLRDELRKRAANRFSQEMTEMRDQARQLDDNQKKLTQRLDETKDRPRTSLRDTGERKQVADGLADQRTKLDKLLDQMRNTVQDAEDTEPLLAKNLYDTVRKANEQKVADALKAAQQLADLGAGDDAAGAARHARQGIEQVREGVERSAKSVLGDEAAALRRAQGELEELADQVNQELAQATGQQPATPGSRNRANGQRGQGQKPEASGQAGAEPAGDPRARDQPGQEPGPEPGRPARQGSASKNAQERNPENGQSGQAGQQERRGQGQEQSRQPAQGQGGQGDPQGGERQQGQQGSGGAQQGGDGPRDGQSQRGTPGQAGRRPGSLRGGNGGAQGGPEQEVGQGAPSGPGRPITGEGFRQWSDRMRDVEELIDNPELRAEAARIRDRARGAREEFKRHAKTPDWNQLKTLVAEPINELRDRIAEEVRRRGSPDALVPIDRDPVPPQFVEEVRRYYERLGSGQ